MSSQFGFYNLDGRLVLNSNLEQAQAAMQRRGTKFAQSIASGSLGLGFTANHPSEGSIYKHPETSIIVSADARLDNQKELCRTLNLRPITNFAELIAKAYFKWGPDCPRFLEGDFAFIIWDPREQHLFCARDRLGLKQLLYHFTPHKVFGCATDAKTLFIHDAIQQRPNETRLLDFFVGLEGIDKTITSFSGVTRLKPGHILQLKNGHLSTSSYWTLEPQEPSKLTTQDQYKEAFTALFTKAVSKRFDSPQTTGVMVSGGMDSSAVAATVYKEFGSTFKGFSAINSEDPYCIETTMIYDVNRHLGIRSIYLDLAKPSLWMSDAQNGLREVSEPFDSHMTLMRAIYGAAKRENMNVVLDGGWGDIIFAPGAHILRKIRSGKLISAWNDLLDERYYHDEKGSLISVYLRMIAASFAPTTLKSKIDPIRLKRHHNHVVKNLGLSKRLVKKHNLIGQLKTFHSHQEKGIWKNPAREAANIITHTNALVGRERYDRVAGYFGLIPRDPFTDLDLVKFCLSLPTDQKTNQGVRKILLRQAMRSTLPSTIILRSTKEHLGLDFTKRIYRINKNPCNLSLPTGFPSIKKSENRLVGLHEHSLYFGHMWWKNN